MRVRLMIVACLATLLCSAAAQTPPTPPPPNQFDLTLEGPWILYQYKNANLGGGVPVLIVVAPKIDNIFHLPVVSAGDGYELWQNGIYCLTFDATCAKPGAKLLTPGKNYPSTNPPTGPLPVKFSLATANGDWDLVSLNRKRSFFALILPMPDSYSNDGVWHMQFSSKFDVSGNGYSGDKGYSIGVQLHYNTGPTTFDLVSCKDLTTAGCKYPVPVANHTSLTNTGTLRIVMKAPNIDNACDPHVRSLYHPTLWLLDDQPFTGPTKNSNQNIAYIDPARRIDDQGHGVYTDAPYTSCYKSDPQANDSPGAGMFMSKTRVFQLDQLNGLIETLQSLNLSAAIIDQLKTVSASLSGQYAYPLSGLSRLAQSLRSAACELEEMGRVEYAEELRRVADDVESKNGADCRAAIMVVGP
jgi:hypothetical protein